MRSLFLALALACAPAAAFAGAPVAKLEQGRVSGAARDGVASYLGLPYAAPPVGDLRWRPPQSPPTWTGVRDASVMSPDCVQGRMPGAAAGAPQSEDCLYLNIWRPERGRRLPVLVWIHGGAFVNGGSSSPETFGEALAARGIVVVTFNSRLGRLGFFGFPALSAERPEEPKVNYGLMDQVAALKWVKHNIAAFGGDPDDITLMGESAGGIAVNLLLGSPQTPGLFQQAVIQSGGGRDLLGKERRVAQDLPGSPSAETIGKAFAAKRGVAGEGAAALAALRALPAEKVTGDLSMMSLVLAGGGALHAGPVVDGKVVTATPEAMFKAGGARPMPVIIGATSADLSLDMTPAKDAIFARFGARADAARAIYDPDGTLSPAALNRAIGGDRSMVEPARFAARSLAASSPVYAYRFAYVAQAKRAASPYGADHASDVAYSFDLLQAMYPGQVGEADRKVAGTWADYLVNFVRTGDPNGPGLADWPTYDAKSDRLMLVGADGGFAAGADPWRPRLDLIEAQADAVSAQRGPVFFRRMARPSHLSKSS